MGDRREPTRLRGLTGEQGDPGARERQLTIGAQLLRRAALKPGPNRLDLPFSDQLLPGAKDDPSGTGEIARCVGVFKRVVCIAPLLVPGGGAPDYGADD